jgi:AMP deaminase
MVKGVIYVYEAGRSTPMFSPPSLEQYYHDYHEIVQIIDKGPVKSFAYHRLQLLESRFNLHQTLNKERESKVQQLVPHRDFYNVRKVDTHVHHSACMNQKHLLRFIKGKLKEHGNDVVIFRDGRFLTLEEVFESLRLTAYDLSIDTLDMHADSTTFHRFDRFNLKYNPCGQSRLREIFLKTDNLLAGRYLAEVTQQVIDELHANKYSMAEYRISIYGRKRSEWEKLGRWFHVNKVFLFFIGVPLWLVDVEGLNFTTCAQ